MHCKYLTAKNTTFHCVVISPVRPLLCMHLITAAQADDGYHGLTVQTTVPQVIYNLRDVTAGATGATAVAPKFSDALTLFQPGGGRFCPTICRGRTINFPAVTSLITLIFFIQRNMWICSFAV